MRLALALLVAAVCFGQGIPFPGPAFKTTSVIPANSTPPVQSNTGGGTGGSTSNSQAFTTHVTSGNLLVLYVMDATDQTTNINSIGWTGGGANCGNLLATPLSPINGSTRRMWVYTAQVTASDCTGTTIAFSASINSIVIFAEYAGLFTSSVIDVEIAGSATGTAITSGTVTTTNQYDTLVGGIFITSAGGGTLTAGASFTSRVNSANARMLEDQDVNATGSYAATATYSSSQSYIAHLLALKRGTPPPVNFDFTTGSLPPAITFTRASTGTYNNSSNVLSTASTNVARFNYLSGTPYLLIEPAATNLLVQSNNLTTTWFPLNGGTLASAQFVSPDGTNNGWTLTNGSSIPGFGAVGQSRTFSNIPYTISVWLKRITGAPPIQLSLNSVNVGDIAATTTLTRYAKTITPAAGTANAMLLLNSGAATDVVGVFGFQLETGNVATSYIPTTTATVTRAADSATFTIPAGVTQLTYTFDDNSQQVVTVSAGSYMIPTNLNRPNIKTITSGAPAASTPTNYYLATAADGGSDSNSGLSAAFPWLSPNHPLNCGDTITAKASTAYSAGNFGSANWGTVTCPTGDKVVWLQCETFGACKISASGTSAMYLSKSYWGVQGWEVTASGVFAACFGAQPISASFHHIIFANNIAKGCGNGFATSSQGSTLGIDYIAVIGNIAWNAAQSTQLCNSGVTIYEPIKSDSAAGTHIYIAGNYSFDNISPVNCLGGTATYDGEGILIDDFGMGQSGGVPYNQQVVVENNLLVWNGGFGLATGGNDTRVAPITFRYNTSVHNLRASPTDMTTCGDLTLLNTSLATVTRNLVMTGAATGCKTGGSLYAVAVNGADATVSISDNWLYSATGSHTTAISSSGFSYGSNTTGTNPAFLNPVDPGAPNCSGKSSVPDCMATVITNYTPGNASARAYGRQPIAAPDTVSDPLFPAWICTVGLPSGLITMHCP
jgi:hypothetical protein